MIKEERGWWIFSSFFYLIFRALIINRLHPQNFSEVVFIRPKIIFRIIKHRIFSVFPRAPERCSLNISSAFVPISL
jgi:hypothetical protein